jgi:nucleoside-diphosphate-sugar epimerase
MDGGAGVRVLVTGHRGFVGSHLCRELHYNGHEVIGHDREEGDLTQPGVFSAALRRHKPDAVIHLAAQVGRLFGEDDLIHTVNANATMTTLVAQACGQVPVLYASTSEVYGDYGDVCEEYGGWLLPRNFYGLTKRWGEEVLALYVEDLKIARLSMPYGPGAPPGRGRRALDNFIWQAHHRMPIPVHRGAERSWCHVSDTVRGLRLILEHGEGVYNVGRDDRPVTMLALAEGVCDMVGAPWSLIQEVEPPERQIVVKHLAMDRLRGLGWQPSVELEHGLPELYEWIRQFDAEGTWRPSASSSRP